MLSFGNPVTARIYHVFLHLICYVLLCSVLTVLLPLGNKMATKFFIFYPKVPNKKAMCKTRTLLFCLPLTAAPASLRQFAHSGVRLHDIDALGFDRFIFTLGKCLALLYFALHGVKGFDIFDLPFECLLAGEAHHQERKPVAVHKVFGIGFSALIQI